MFVTVLNTATATQEKAVTEENFALRHSVTNNRKYMSNGYCNC